MGRQVEELLERYRSAFVRGDVGALVDCFAFPLQVLSATDGEVSSSVADRQGWPGVLEGLLGAYWRLGVADCVPLVLGTTEVVDGVAVVRVHWALQRAGGEPVYDFTAAYTLVRRGGALRIVAVAHDELPRMRAALRGR